MLLYLLEVVLYSLQICFYIVSVAVVLIVVYGLYLHVRDIRAEVSMYTWTR